MNRRRVVASLLILTWLFPVALFAEERPEGVLPRARPGLDPAVFAPFLLASAGEDSSGAATRSADPENPPTKAESGAKVGLIVGATAGAAFFIFIGLLSEALCEGGDCGDIKPLGWVGLGVGGAAAGALAGALVGSVFGAMIPGRDEGGRHVPAAEPGPGEGSVPAKEPASRRFIASFTVQPGFARLTQRPTVDSALSFRATLLAHIKPWLAIGPEYTHASLAGGMNALGGTVQLGKRGRRLSPYLVGDLGMYRWATGLVDTDQTLLGAGFGAGVAWSPGSGRHELGLEGRYHWSPQNIESPEGYRFVMLGATARLNW